MIRHASCSQDGDTCPECGQERFEIELADCVWWGCGCGDNLTAMVEGGGMTGRIMVDELVQPLNARHRCFARGTCHLTTDGDLEQLHAFARRLGLKQAWFQAHPLHPHYDLTAGKRRRALEMGAVFVPAREQATARLRARGVLP